MESEQSIVEEGTGEVYSKTVSSNFFVGQGNWGGPKGIDTTFYEDFEDWSNHLSGPSTVNYAPPQGKAPDATDVVQTTMETAHLYR